MTKRMHHSSRRRRLAYEYYEFGSGMSIIWISNARSAVEGFYWSAKNGNSINSSSDFRNAEAFQFSRLTRDARSLLWMENEYEKKMYFVLWRNANLYVMIDSEIAWSMITVLVGSTSDKLFCAHHDQKSVLNPVASANFSTRTQFRDEERKIALKIKRHEKKEVWHKKMRFFRKSEILLLVSVSSFRSFGGPGWVRPWETDLVRVICSHEPRCLVDENVGTLGHEEWHWIAKIRKEPLRGIFKNARATSTRYAKTGHFEFPRRKRKRF